MSVPTSQLGSLGSQQGSAASLTDSTSGLDYLDPGNMTLDTPQFNAPLYDNTTNASGSSGLSSLGSDISSILGSDLGNLALYGGAGALLGSQASSAAGQNAQLAGGISAIGAPALGESNDLLKAYGSGTLTSPFQQQLQSALTFNQQQATSQQQSVAQMLANSGGGANIQSAQAGQNQQIQAQQSQLNTQATAQAFAGELSASEGLLSAGGPFVQQGILSEIQSNQQLQQQLQQLFSGLASSYAQGQGGSTTTGGRAPNLGGGIGNLINQIEGSNTSALTSSLQGTVNDLGSGIGDNALSGASSDFGAASTFNDVAGSASDAGGVLSDIGYFNSAGGAAAGAADATDLGTVGLASSVTADPAAASAIDAANAGATGGSAFGAAVPIVGAGLGAYSTVNNIESGNALGAGLSGAETGAAIGSFIGPEGTLIGAGIGGLVGLGGALIKGKHTEENVAQVGPGQQVIKLQSGNSALQQGGVAFGAGSSRGQGSAQWFLVPQQSMNNGKGFNATKGSPFYIGNQASQDLTDFANSVPLKNGQPDFSKYIQQYQQNPNAGTGLVGVFNNNGGAATWGQSFPQWLQSIWSVKHNVTGNLST